MSLSTGNVVHVVMMMEDYAGDESKQSQPISLPLSVVDLY